jgi:hypothetical protein
MTILRSSQTQGRCWTVSRAQLSLLQALEVELAGRAVALAQRLILHGYLSRQAAPLDAARRNERQS